MHCRNKLNINSTISLYYMCNVVTLCYSISFADSLRYTSALSVALAVVFLVVTVGITIFKLINGSILMPRLLPSCHDLTSFLKLFTVVPVLVTAYICHYNGNGPIIFSCGYCRFVLLLIFYEREVYIDSTKFKGRNISAMLEINLRYIFPIVFVFLYFQISQLEESFI